MTDPYTTNRRSIVTSLLGEDTASTVLVLNNQPPSEYAARVPRDGGKAPERQITTATYALWALAIVWVLAMLVGGSFVLRNAVRNDDDVEALERQQAIFESEFCEFCRPDANPAIMLKTLGVYEVDPTVVQFQDGYTIPGFRCAVGGMTRALEFSQSATTGAGILRVSGARLRPRAQLPSDVPFITTFGATFSIASSTSATRCIANSSFPFAGETGFYLVQTLTGPFPCECNLDTGAELCYNYPQDMGVVNPIIDNTGMGIIP